MKNWKRHLLDYSLAFILACAIVAFILHFVFDALFI